MFTRDMLERVWPDAPDSKLDGVMAVAADVFKEFNIGVDEDMVIAHAMAQISHENGRGTIVRENMNYTTAKRLLDIFGDRHSAKIQPYEVNKYLRHPVELAERAYGLDNPGGKKQKEFGHTKRGQAYMYRGNGDMQTTGYKKHLLLGTALKLPLVDKPELLQDPKISFRAAVWEFDELNATAAARKDDIVTVTQRINGGQNGIADRRKLLAQWKAELGITAEDSKKAKTKAAVAAVKKATAPGAKAPTPKEVEAMIKFGDEGPEVLIVQELLASKLYWSGAKDSKFSTNLRKAVLAFQADNDLDTDGVVGPKTMDVLKDPKTPVAVISEERATATADDLRKEGSVTIKAADKTGFMAKVLTTLGIGGAAEKTGVLDQAESAVEVGGRVHTIVEGAKDFLGELASFWWVAAVGIGFYIIWSNRQVILARVEAHRTGANLGA